VKFLLLKATIPAEEVKNFTKEIEEQIKLIKKVTKVSYEVENVKEKAKVIYPKKSELDALEEAVDLDSTKEIGQNSQTLSSKKEEYYSSKKLLEYEEGQLEALSLDDEEYAEQVLELESAVNAHNNVIASFVEERVEFLIRLLKLKIYLHEEKEKIKEGTRPMSAQGGFSPIKIGTESQKNESPFEVLYSPEQASKIIEEVTSLAEYLMEVTEPEKIKQSLMDMIRNTLITFNEVKKAKKERAMSVEEQEERQFPPQKGEVTEAITTRIENASQSLQATYDKFKVELNERRYRGKKLPKPKESTQEEILSERLTRLIDMMNRKTIPPMETPMESSIVLKIRKQMNLEVDLLMSYSGNDNTVKSRLSAIQSLLFDMSFKERIEAKRQPRETKKDHAKRLDKLKEKYGSKFEIFREEARELKVPKETISEIDKINKAIEKYISKMKKGNKSEANTILEEKILGDYSRTVVANRINYLERISSNRWKSEARRFKFKSTGSNKGKFNEMGGELATGKQKEKTPAYRYTDSYKGYAKLIDGANKLHGLLENKIEDKSVIDLIKGNVRLLNPKQLKRIEAAYGRTVEGEIKTGGEYEGNRPVTPLEAQFDREMSANAEAKLQRILEGKNKKELIEMAKVRNVGHEGTKKVIIQNIMQGKPQEEEPSSEDIEGEEE